MEYDKYSDPLCVKVSVADEKRNIPNNQALKSGGQYKDVCYSDLQNTKKNITLRAAESEDNSEPGAGPCCTWKVTAIVFIALTVLLLITVLTTGGIWLRESDILAVSQKTSMERTKQQQEEEEQKRVERERQIRAEEEKKRIEREKEIMAKEEQKRVEREQEIRAEEEQKRVEREREIRAEEEKKRIEREQEIRAQCNSAQIINISSTGLGVLLPLLLLNCLIMDY